MDTAKTTMSRRGFLGVAATGAAALAGLALVGCASRAEQAAAPTGEVTTQPDASEQGASETASPETAGASGTGRALVAVFSWSGNTLQVAEAVQAQTGADLVRIETSEPYTTNYDEVLDVAQREQNEGYLPPLSTSVSNLADYDTVYVGYPIWWYDAPPAVKSFLTHNDLSGKVVAPFCTSGGSDISTSLASVQGLCPSSTILEGLTVTESNLTSADERVASWLDTLGVLS